MELIDNKSKLLGDDLKNELKPNSNIRIVASCFSIYAFEALKKELSEVKELEFIFPMPTFAENGIKGTVKKESKEFFIPKQLREASLYGNEFEIKLRNQLIQRVIAKECAEWIKKKVRFKSNITKNGLQNFIYVDNEERKTTYTPINGFTAVDLGYEQSNMYYQGIIKHDDEQYSKLLQDAVNSILHREEQSDLDVLFSGDAMIVFNKNINGLDDFELITFVVVK